MATQINFEIHKTKSYHRFVSLSIALPFPDDLESTRTLFYGLHLLIFGGQNLLFSRR